MRNVSIEKFIEKKKFNFIIIKLELHKNIKLNFKYIEKNAG